MKRKCEEEEEKEEEEDEKERKTEAMKRVRSGGGARWRNCGVLPTRGHQCCARVS